MSDKENDGAQNRTGDAPDGRQGGDRACQALEGAVPGRPVSEAEGRSAAGLALGNQGRGNRVPEGSAAERQALTRKNRRVGLAVLAGVAAMVGLSYAAVPLYDLFCRVTGYNGTTRVAQELPPNVLDRTITVKFDAGTGGGLNWHFRPEERQISVRLGERALTAYQARNRTGRAMTGTALYNVTPLRAGKYFNKIECFCFAEQVLGAGQDATLPVVFYIDPAMDSDPEMRDIRTITLSYTFFERGGSALDKAMEDFYNQADGAQAPVAPRTQ